MHIVESILRCAPRLPAMLMKVGCESGEVDLREKWEEWMNSAVKLHLALHHSFSTIQCFHLHLQRRLQQLTSPGLVLTLHLHLVAIGSRTARRARNFGAPFQPRQRRAHRHILLISESESPDSPRIPRIHTVAARLHYPSGSFSPSLNFFLFSRTPPNWWRPRTSPGTATSLLFLARPAVTSRDATLGVISQRQSHDMNHGGHGTFLLSPRPRFGIVRLAIVRSGEGQRMNG